MTKEEIIENLRDAGCNEDTINHYFAAIDAGDCKEAIHILEKHREKLLEQFHASNDCICCLDFFVTKSEKENGKHI
ncbi:MAG TPA: hypothetical protein PKV44_01785 [Bacillota bacterium]|nr:hypothetical protein [Bacillota bacterium]HPE38959.1 hypothetical protein [Bacillota bacterium]